MIMNNGFRREGPQAQFGKQLQIITNIDLKQYNTYTYTYNNYTNSLCNCNRLGSVLNVQIENMPNC